jgi:hypothetical protein
VKRPRRVAVGELGSEGIWRSERASRPDTRRIGSNAGPLDSPAALHG